MALEIRARRVEEWGTPSSDVMGSRGHRPSPHELMLGADADSAQGAEGRQARAATAAMAARPGQGVR